MLVSGDVRWNWVKTLTEKGGSCAVSNVYYSVEIRYVITASFQKINHNQVQRKSIEAVRSSTQ